MNQFIKLIKKIVLLIQMSWHNFKKNWKNLFALKKQFWVDDFNLLKKINLFSKNNYLIQLYLFSILEKVIYTYFIKKIYRKQFYL